jgi:hypothetical protein
MKKTLIPPSPNLFLLVRRKRENKVVTSSFLLTRRKELRIEVLLFKHIKIFIF